MNNSAGYPALGFNPTPGKPDSVSVLAETLQKVAADVGDAHHELSRVGRDGGIWTGRAAEAFQHGIGPLPGYLEKANRSLGEAGQVLARWASDLSSMQRVATHYEAEAEQAQQQLQLAESHPDLTLADHQFPDPASQAHAEARREAATQAVTRANEELEAIRQQARRLQHQHEELVDNVVQALDRAEDDAIPRPGLLDWIGELFSQLARSIADLASKAWDFIKRHAEDIAAIGDALTMISGVLAAIAIVTAPIQPIGTILAGASGIASGAALVTHSLAKAAGADVSWGYIATDAIGLIPFGKGFAMGSKTHVALKGNGLVNHVAAGADDAARGIRQGQWLGTRGLAKIGVHIEPMSGVGRALDAGITGGTSVGAYIYQQLQGPEQAHIAAPSSSAGQIMQDRVTARGAA